MPRFYFEVIHGSQIFQDDEGVELPDVDTTERVATELAVALGQDVLPKVLARSPCRSTM